MDHLQQFLKIIVTECMENLKEPELKLAKPCGRILMYSAMASGKLIKRGLFEEKFSNNVKKVEEFLNSF